MVPIAKSIFDEYASSFHLFMCCIAAAGEVKVGCGWAMMVRLDGTARAAAKQLAGVSRQTFDVFWRRLKGDLPFTITEEFICFTPNHLIRNFCSWLDAIGVAPKAYNGLARVFFWLYFNSRRTTHGYYRSVEDMAQDLHMDAKDISKRLKILEEGGWIKRGSFNAAAGLARTYKVEENNKWNKQQ